ncbi:MAG TPA: outer membrane lipoprotein chaperone LolA [Casimicrobiaceae bacterium]|nr:outer membrane lipoprotein chaperone LolA [Casimicrobiaceae bacterium]
MTARVMARVTVAALLALAFASPSALASGLDQLHAFLEGTKSAEGDFTQTVVRRDGRTTQKTSGSFAFQRPGRFRWAYDKPFEQLIVGDGARIWIYDHDLDQVIVRKLDVALGETPAALLAGDNALEQNFTLIAAGDGDGLEYVDAIPKAHDSQFKKIRLGFAGDLPRRMVLTDAFGQTTTLDFTAMKRNPVLAPSTFHFTPPAGADVVGE